MIQRYLFKESFLPFLLITVTLTILMTTAELADTVQLVVAGRYEQAALYKILGMYMPMLIPELLPAAYFLALLISQNRLNQESERTIINAMGLADKQIAHTLLLSTALPVTLIMLLFTVWITPNFSLQFEQYRVSQKNRPVTDLIDIGEFYSLPQNYGTLFANGAAPEAGELLNLYVFKQTPQGQQVITAERLSLKNDNSQYLSFSNGTVYQASLQGDAVIQNFATHNILLPGRESKYKNDKLSTMSSLSLLKSKSQWRQSELSWRLIYPFMIPVLCIWAIGLTKSKPRQSKVGALAFGLALFILYNFASKTLHASVIYSKIPLWADGWWVHLIAFLLGWFLFMRNRPI